MDRNLGASRVANSATDEMAYGDLYQWGRPIDGHERRISPTTSTLSGTDVPGHGSFIKVDVSPYDWRNPQNDTLWQGVSGPNNPCPAGFRLPMSTELNSERASWESEVRDSEILNVFFRVKLSSASNLRKFAGFRSGTG